MRRPAPPPTVEVHETAATPPTATVPIPPTITAHPNNNGASQHVGARHHDGDETRPPAGSDARSLDGDPALEGDGARTGDDPRRCGLWLASQIHGVRLQSCRCHSAQPLSAVFPACCVVACAARFSLSGRPKTSSFNQFLPRLTSWASACGGR